MPILNWKDLQNLNQQKQKGITFETEAPIVSGQQIPQEEWDEFNAGLEDYFNASRAQRLANDEAARAAYVEQMSNLSDASSQSTDDYGAFRKDTDVPYHEWINDPQNYRAHAQSEVGKLANGFAKLVPYTATTFLDNTVGLAAGIANVFGDLVDGEGGFHPVNSFVDTPFAEDMQKIREWSEKIFPNYRTTEEQEDQDEWWKHLNANFWGDTFIKNLGFTIGAGLAGGLYAKGFQAMRGGIMRNAYRAAVAASVDGDMAAEAAFQRVLQGARQDVKSIYTTFNSVHDSYRRMSAMSQIIGGIGGAIGESRTEAIMAAKELRDAYLQDADNRFEMGKSQLAQSIMSNPNYYNEYGLTDSGQLAWQNGLNALTESYSKTVEAINNEVDDVANSVFWMNMPLLTASNMIMFGRMFSGGYKSQAKKLVKGTLGNYSEVGSIGKDIVRGVRNSLSEGVEELSQKIFSEGAKDVADTNMAAFHNGKYDKDAIKTVSQWLMSMRESARNVVTDPTSWEEFAVGALTGALGMPTRHGWSGGIIGAFQEGAKERSDSKKYVEELNKLPESKLETLFGGLVRHVETENAKEQALKNKDSFTWHGENDKQLMNSVMMFANAGVLNDLEDYVDSFLAVDEKDVSVLRSAFEDISGTDSKNMTDAQVRDWMRERAFEVKRTINQYRDFHDSVDFLSLGTTDPEVIDEIVFTRAQLENFETRYNEVLDDVIKNLMPTIEQVATEKKKDGTPTERADRAKKLLESESELRRLFGGFAMDIKARAQDDGTKKKALVPSLIDDMRQQEVLEELEAWGAFTKDPSLKEKVEDLQKLVRSRQNYYAKLYDPSFRAKFNEEAVKPEDVADEISKENKIKKADEYAARLEKANNIEEFFNISDQIDENDPETMALLNERIAKSPKLAAFDKRITDFSDSAYDLRDAISAAEASAENPSDSIALEDIVEALDGLEENMNDIIIGSGDENPTVTIGRRLLEELDGNDRAQKLARSILLEKLGDIAEAEGLGPVKVDDGEGAGPGSNAGTTGNVGEGEGADAGGEQVTDFQKAAERLSVVRDLDDPVLRQVLNSDFSDLGELTDDEKMSLQAIAVEREQKLKARANNVVTDEDPKIAKKNLEATEAGAQDESKKTREHADFVVQDTRSIRGFVVPGYAVDSAKQGKKVPFRGSNPGINAVVDWMRAHNVQGFVDSGALSKLEEAYRKKGEKLPIYFIGNPHYVKGNLANNPFAKRTKGNKPQLETILAIEMNDENRKVLKAFENKGVFSGDTLITIGDTKYQPIGQLYNPYIGKDDGRPDDERELYKTVKENAQKIWTYSFDKSIIPQYDADLNNNVDIPIEGKWYVAREEIPENDEKQVDFDSSNRIYTTLNYISSGRNEYEITDDNTRKIPLADSLKDYKSYGGEYYFAIQTGTETVYQDGAPEKISSAIDAPPGSLWLTTKEANNSWGWTYVTVLNADEFSFADNANTRFVQDFDKQMDILFADSDAMMSNHEKELDFERRLNACHALSDMFYLGEGNSIRIQFFGGRPMVVVGGASCFNRDQVIDALKAGKYKFQVDIYNINDKQYINNLIEAGILRSEMSSFIRMNASFGVNFLIDRDINNNPVKPYPNDTHTAVSWTAGSEYANVWGADSAGFRNIRIGDANYRLDEDGSVYMMSMRGRGDRIENRTTVAQVKAISELMDSVSHDALSNYPGDRFIVEHEGYQYTELYERVMDDVRVRLQRRGKNGAIKLIYSNDEWNALMEVAERPGNKYMEPAKTETDEERRDKDLEEFDKMREKEDVEVAPPNADKKKVLGSTFDMMMDDSEDDEDDILTVQDKDKEDSKDQEDQNCGKTP